ncbi:hypothetical protein DEX24_16765, partial [Kurthia sibirica]
TVVPAQAGTHNHRVVLLKRVAAPASHDNQHCGYGSLRSQGRHQTCGAAGEADIYVLATCFARALLFVPPSLEQRAQGKPGADRTHGPRAMGRKLGGRTTGVTGNNPAFPARWVTAYFVLSPARLGLLVTARA